MIKFKIKKDDMVKVIAGDDKGKVGKVLAVLPKSAQVIVEGCKFAKKSIKPKDNETKGGFVNKEMPMSISNVTKAEEK
ncbi:50S ribosomal protein L24 [Helicobacter sp. 13S00477-4]|uniref:50S ribosomal protein L24 n=1 Tax=Helicobacter sp. 13S00477-4 TaxID=1905759 RepID=UPI000BA55255|nr:50S ribosomal protein L24 [Helicobacter sp. 13S00477-4]PAF52099.1 50S ribosomal protein L24 [Helicobacter sp. 13S00477-4]